MIDIKEIENDIMEQEKGKTEGEHSLSYLLIRDAQLNAKRWFIIAMAELFAILAIVAGMIWYNSLPVEEVQYVTQDTDGDANHIVGIGDSHYGDTAESSNLQAAENDSK